MILTCLAAVLMACCALTSCKNGNDDDDDNTPVATITTSQTQSGGSSGSSGGSGSGSSGGGGSSSGTATVVGFMYITGDSATQATIHFSNDTYTEYDSSQTATVDYTISGSTIEFSDSGVPVCSAAIITSGTSFKIDLGGGSAGSGSGTITTLNGKTYVGTWVSTNTIVTFTEGTAPSSPTITMN